MLRALHPRSNHPPDRVADLINQVERGWNRGAVFEHVQIVDAQAILNIPLSIYTIRIPWAWHYEKSGSFSVRLVYCLIMEIKRRRKEWLEISRGTQIFRAPGGNGQSYGNCRFRPS